MSDSAVRNLRLVLTLDDQASAALKQQQAAQVKGIKQAADEQAKADAAYVKAIKAHLAAEKQLEDQKTRSIKHAADEQAKADAAYLKAVKANLAAEKQLEDQKIRAARDAAKAQADAAKSINALLKQLAKDEQKLADDKAKAEKKAAKDAFAAWKQAMDQQHREAMQAWRDEQRAIKETEREKIRANQAVNALLKDFARDEAKLAKQVAAEKKAADRDAFRDWKMGADQKHREAMAAFEEERREQEQFGEDMKRTGVAIGALATGALAVFASHFGKIREDAYHAAEDVMKMRGAVRELQALRGEMGDTGAGVAHVMAGAARTLQTPEEYQQTELAGLGVGELAIKDKKDRAEFEKAMVAAGRMQAMEGGSPEAYGQMAGQIALQTKGPLNAATMQGQMNRLYQIQQPGGFKSMDQALGQYSSLNAYVMNGIYSPEEAMGLVSAFSVSNPNEAGTKAEQFTRAVMAGRIRARGMAVGKDIDLTKSAEYFKGLGIKEEDSAIERGKKIAADLASQGAKAKAGGKKFNAVEYLMTHGFANQQDALAIMDYAGLKNSGKLDKIEAAQNAPLDNGAINRRFEEKRRTDQRLRDRQQDVLEQTQRATSGVGDEPLIEVQHAAFNELYAEGKMRGTFEEWKKKGFMQRTTEDTFYSGPDSGDISIPGFGGYNNQVNKRAQEKLRATRKAMGLPDMPQYQYGGGPLGFMGRSEEEMMAQSAREIREKGGDPIRGAAEKLDKAAENLRRATERQTLPLVAPPMPRGR